MAGKRLEKKEALVMGKSAKMEALSALRVGFISLYDPNKLGALSGVVHSSFQALVSTGLDVVPILAESPVLHSKSIWCRMIRKLTHRLQPFTEYLLAPLDYRRTISQAMRHKQCVEEQINKGQFDVFVCVFANSALYGLNTTLPIIYSTDATASLLTSTYEYYRRKSKGFKKALYEMECCAFDQANFLALPSNRTIQSAVKDYGFSKHQIRLVPFGANVVPDSLEVVNPREPTEGTIQLTVVGKDPLRKRVQFCIDIAHCLQQMGYDAHLNYIGAPFLSASRSSLVTCYGPLKLSKIEDRTLHKTILSKTHFFLMPSSAEMYGIAAAEAAHFACPSLVSDVGGLPTVVLDGKTGLVFPLEASPKDYARGIVGFCNDPKRYREMSLAAQKRAQTSLTWEAWGNSVASLILEATM